LMMSVTPPRTANLDKSDPLLPLVEKVVAVLTRSTGPRAAVSVARC
jgi:hypothetical protein